MLQDKAALMVIFQRAGASLRNRESKRVPKFNTSLKSATDRLCDFICHKTNQHKIVSLLIAPSDLPSNNLDCGNPYEAIFEIRTIAGLVTPAQGPSDLSIGASLEYGVRILNAKHIFQITYTDSSFINSLLKPQQSDSKVLTLGDFLPKFLNLAGGAISGSLMSHQQEDRKRYLIEELLRVGFENLMTYPWILDRVWTNQLELHGGYIDTQTDSFRIFSPLTDKFEDVKHQSDN